MTKSKKPENFFEARIRKIVSEVSFDEDEMVKFICDLVYEVRDQALDEAQAEIKRLRSALERIMDHQTSLINGEVRLSTTYLMASKALLEKSEGE